MKLSTSIVLAAVALVASCVVVDEPKLKHALRDDQTLFLRGAETIRGGGVLYRDFWDIKPPGIFLVYLAGGEVFGFTDVGIRLMELTILVSFSLVAFFWLGPVIGYRGVWFGCVLSILFYNYLSEDADLGTVEGLACLPMAVAAFGLLAPRSKARLALAGASVGCLILMKQFYGLLGVALWLVFLIADRDAGRRLKTWVILAASAALPIVLTVVWFAWLGALPDLINAVFRVPFEARHLIHPMMRLFVLRAGFAHFWRGTLALQVLLVAAAWAAYVKRHDHKMRVALTLLVAWIVVGAVAILMQLQSWWEYHWLLILPALALLAGFGLDWALTQTLRASSPAKRTVAALLVLLAIWEGRALARPYAEDLLTGKGAAETRQYAGIMQNEASQVQCAPGDTAFVWMSPLIPRFSNCRLASHIEGDNMTVLPPSVIARARADIQRYSPRYLYLMNRDVIRPLPWPNFERVLPGILDQYDLVYKGSWGSWYRRK